MPANVLEENSRQMDRHKKRLVFRTLTDNSEVCAKVHALQSGGDSAPGRQRWACLYRFQELVKNLIFFCIKHPLWCYPVVTSANSFHCKIILLLRFSEVQCSITHILLKNNVLIEDLQIFLHKTLPLRVTKSEFRQAKIAL